VWIAHAEEYTLTLWSLDGKKQRTLHPVRDWFEAGRFPAGGRRDPRGILRPNSLILDIQETTDGSIVVLGRGPAVGWRDALGPDGERTSFVRYFDYFLEVFSPDGALRSSTRFQDVLIHGFLDADRVFGTVYDDTGFKTAIWRIVFQPEADRL